MTNETNEEAYRRKLVEHGTAVTALLNAADPAVAAFMRDSYRLNLYPLDFVKDQIEKLTRFRAADPETAPRAGWQPPRIVQQPWTWTIPLRMQSLLMLAMRGPDGCAKENTAKALLRELRSVTLVPAFPGRPDSFMGRQRGLCEWAVVEAFKESHDEYPHHWLMHFIHATEVVGQLHPDDDIRAFWWNVYVAMCRAMHMQNENIDELFRRLGDPEPDPRREGAPDHA